MKDIDASHYCEAKCPFYTRCTDKDGVYSVRCQGLIEDGGIILWFKRKRDREIQFEAFCASRYSNCEIYEAIMKARFENDGD